MLFQDLISWEAKEHPSSTLGLLIDVTLPKSPVLYITPAEREQSASVLTSLGHHFASYDT